MAKKIAMEEAEKLKIEQESRLLKMQMEQEE